MGLNHIIVRMWEGVLLMKTETNTSEAKLPVLKIAHLSFSVWFITFLLVALIMGMVAFELTRSYKNATQSAYDTARLNGHLIAEWVAESFHNIEYLLRDISSTVENTSDLVPLRVAPFSNPFNRDLIRKAHLDSNLLFLGVNAVDGTLVYSSIESLLGDSAKDLKRDYYNNAIRLPQNQFKVSNAFVSSTGRINVTATYPVLMPDKELIGFSLAGLDLSFFQRWLNRIEQPSITISIIDDKKTLLARKPPSEKIGQTMDIELLDRFMELGRGTGTFRLVSPLDSTDRLWSIRRIRDLPFVVAVGYSTHHALEGWYTKLYIYIAGTLIISIVSVLLALRYLANVRLLRDLKTALSDVKTLSGLLPICSFCKKIRDDKGYWNQLEKYIHEHSNAKFSHGICQECAKKHYPGIELYKDSSP